MGTYDFSANAAKYGMAVNESRRGVIEAALRKRNGYCPCSIEMNADTLCPCKSMRENHDCHCGLYEEKL